MKKRIVITGNIGSGKSTVTKIFEDNGYKVISADEISAKILEENHRTVSKMFGMPPQKFSTFKKTISNLVFQDKEFQRLDYKKELENFMLPLIKQEINNQALSFSMSNMKYVIELPTYFETNGLSKNSEDFIIMVQTDKDIRVNRILERNPHLSIQDVLNRIKSQINPSEKIEYCDEVIWNNDTVQELEQETQKIIDKLGN